MIKKITFFTFILFFHFANAGTEDSLQVKKHTIIRGILISPFTGFSMSPATTVDTSIISKGYIGSSYSTIGIWLAYNLKMNLIQLSNESCVAINAPLTVGVGAFFNNDAGLGVLHLSLPLLLSYDIGAGSTFVAEAEKGHSFALGAEFNAMPLFFVDANEAAVDDPVVAAKVAPYVKSFYVLPMVMYSQRKWSKNSGFLNNKAVKFGLMPYSYTDLSNNSKRTSVAFSIGFSFGGFYNY